MTTSERTTLDVSALPTVRFGHREILWWGSVGFMVIEGFTLALAAASYMYLRRNFDAWPPPRTAFPDLLIPTVSMLFLLACCIPQVWANRAAHRWDLKTVRRAMLITSIMAVGAVALRALEFGALNTRWDSHAYGSITWLILGLHTTLILMDAADTIVFTALLYMAPVEPKHLANVGDNALYFYFVAASWIPLYLLLFLSPRLPG